MLCCGKPKEPFSCEVILLDGSRLTFSKNQNVKLTSKGFILFQAVCQHLNLVENDYFGLKFYGIHGTVHWVDPIKPLCSDEFFMEAFVNEPCTLYFGVKFYAADPNKIKEEVTRYQFFLQLKQDLFTSKLTCSWKKAAELSALAIQSEIGDYHPTEHKSGYVSEFRFVKNQDEKFETEVARLHAMFKGLVPASAEAQYLRKCHQLDTYGVEMHSVKGDAGMQFTIGISPRGIETFRNKYRIAVYYWPRIERVDYKEQVMKVEVKTKQGRETTHSFELQSNDHCKALWKSVVEHHVFYRLPQNVSHATWSKKFRYSGRTEAELLQSEVEREEPEVHRGSSKRYPPRSDYQAGETAREDNGEVAKTTTTNGNAAKSADDLDNNKSWNEVLQKKGMFSVSDAEHSAVKYMTPKSERRERNRQLQSLSDNENRSRKLRSHRGRSSGEESDSPSKRRIRRSRHNRSNNYQSDASDASHRRRRRAYYTDTEMGNRVRADIEKSKRRQHTNSVSSPKSETSSQRKQKRLSREDEQARLELWQHIRRDHVDPGDSPDNLHDIPYTEIKTQGNPYPNRRHSRQSNRRNLSSSGLGGELMEDGMVSPLQITTTVQREKERNAYGNGHYKYSSSPRKTPGKDWDTRTPLAGVNTAQRPHHVKTSDARRSKDGGLKLVYSHSPI